MVYKSVIKILTTKVSVSSCCLNFKNTVINRQKRHIKCPTTKVKNKNSFFFFCFIIHTICNSSRSGFIDNTKNIQARNCTSVFGRLPLRIIKISRDGDNRVGDLVPKIVTGDLFHFDEDHRRNLFGVICFFLVFVFHLDNRFIEVVTFNHKRPVTNILLNLRVIDLPPNKALRIKHRV